MIFTYLQSMPHGRNQEVLYRITVLSAHKDAQAGVYTIRPEKTIPKRVYESANLDRQELLSAPPFCDIADDLIDLYANKKMVFWDRKQFALLRHQFKIIGFNFKGVPIFVYPGKTPRDVLAAFADTLGTNVGAEHSIGFALKMLDYMKTVKKDKKERYAQPNTNADLQLDWKKYKPLPGVYFFLNNIEEVLYVGKAKNIRKRLQGHFSRRPDKGKLDYSQVKNILVEYAGNDFIAQLMESEAIKRLQPTYNTQQINNSPPYIINKTYTANGIARLKITRKEIKDNLPEKYFNRDSVKQALLLFRDTYGLCRKYCGIESVKGPCSDYGKNKCKGICAGVESREAYNERFGRAIKEFEARKERKIFKMKGRSSSEDAFVYMVNDVYEGYGFIDKSAVCYSINDLLGFLTPQKNNYDTSRIIHTLQKKIPKENILILPKE
ncbi:MAG TPA: nucleotide excision repair endonuclease [Aequorivita sp.]|nr:nucleotide excision repair endonuclease [Aequorivita sp.]